MDLTELLGAAAGALVDAITHTAWDALRPRVLDVLAHGDERELNRQDAALDRTRRELRESTGDRNTAIRDWRTRLGDLVADGLLDEAALRDLIDELRTSTEAPPSTGSSSVDMSVAGDVTDSVVVGRDLTQHATTTIGPTTINKKKSSATILLVIAAIAVLIVVYVFVDNASSSKSAEPSLIGLWQPSDGTDPKIMKPGGSCSGWFYNQGEPLDIGGPMTCELGVTPDSKGQHLLVVTQTPNRATYRVGFADSDNAVVRTASGRELYKITRQ